MLFSLGFPLLIYVAIAVPNRGDTLGPAAGGIVSLLALVSGNCFPLGEG